MLCELEPEAPFEPLTSDADFRRQMKMSSLSLLRAIEVARGLYPVEPPVKRRVLPRVVRDGALGASIIAAVALAYDMSSESLLSRKRNQRWVNARMVAIRLLRDLKWNDGTARYSTPQIGRMMGGRDHSTICNALYKFDAVSELYPFMRSVYTSLSDDGE